MSCHPKRLFRKKTNAALKIREKGIPPVKWTNIRKHFGNLHWVGEILGGGNSNMFYFHPYLLGEIRSNLTIIFFRWVGGSTTNDRIWSWPQMGWCHPTATRGGLFTLALGFTNAGGLEWKLLQMRFGGATVNRKVFSKSPEITAKETYLKQVLSHSI